MADLHLVKSRLDRLNTVEERWKRDHQEAMQVLDVQETVDGVLGVNSSLRTILLHSDDACRDSMIAAYRLQLELFDVAQNIERAARTWESVGFTLDRVDELRQLISDLSFTHGSIKDTIQALEEVSEADLRPLNECLNDLRNSLQQ